MPIYYTFIGPIQSTYLSSETSKEYPLSSSQIKNKVHRRIKLLQGIIPGEHPRVCEYQTISRMKLVETDGVKKLEEDKDRQQTESPKFKELKLPIFKTLEDCESAIEKLTTLLKPLFVGVHVGTHYIPVLIKLENNASLRQVAEFKYPNVTFNQEDQRNRKIAYFSSNIQFVEYSPPVILDNNSYCAFIDPETLDNDGEGNKRRPNRIISFKNADGFFVTWNAPALKDNKEQPDDYEYYWNYSSLIGYTRGQKVAQDESISEKAARIFYNYAHPFTQNMGIPKLPENFAKHIPTFFAKLGRKAEQMATGHWDREHSRFAEIIAAKLKEPERKNYTSKQLLEFLKEEIEKEGRRTDKLVIFKQNGSFIARVNFITTQLTEGRITDYREINSEKRDSFELQSSSESSLEEGYGNKNQGSYFGSTSDYYSYTSYSNTLS